LPFLGFSSEENTSYEDDRPGFDDGQQLYIDPVECVDCGACVPVSPVSAIFALDDRRRSGNNMPNSRKLRARR
jgi:NAD-dependent dihydropyrimidine dehydrogenase PreA subunit